MGWGFPAYEPAGPRGSGTTRSPGTEGYAPPGWPSEVRPPGAPAWEKTASAWLLHLCPPDWRGYPGLRRHLVVLARFAVLHVEACQAAVRRGLSEARAELRDVTGQDTVEAAIETHPDVAECAVLGIPHPYTGESVKALVVVRPGATLTVEEVVAHCARSLARFKCPTAVAFVDGLPHSATGKVSKGRLREQSA